MITVKPMGSVEGKDVFLYTLQQGISVDISSYGATITAIRVPDKCGNTVDVALGSADLQQLTQAGSYMGAVVGRCGNRIADGKFTLEGKEYSLAKNDGGKAHLHGGNVGFNKKVFSARTEGNSVYFSLRSPDGEENYPAALDLTVKYTVSGCGLTIEYFAQSDGTTLCNPTNHAYFNLNGESDGSILDNVVTLNADSFLAVDKCLIPTEEKSVKRTPFDFTQPKPIGKDINCDDAQLKTAGGYDHNFCLKGSHAATVYSPKTGIIMDCYTDRPGIQFYSGNFLDGEQGKSLYAKRSGFCLETQLYPDAVNHPKWQSPILKKGENFYTKTQYLFSVK